ncbi:MAG: bifunctional homocysteine S-methyltransferase/methylenetetrahydrofolate reductase [Vicinamibacteraceae bacterium]|nr:bifunctional homocysteine S-methyltransferase/methylenetetrahydrofolate reductase [Vicinamibacteraceae bacterium]
MTRPFLEALDSRVLVCDGAMGTMLYARGIFLNRSFDELNLTQPDLVAEVHQAYVRAGADVIETNTFGANRVKLATFGLAEKLHDINLQGARLARHAAREDAYVAGAIGPLGIRVEPWGKTGLDEAEAWFREQALALMEGGVDLFILETFRDVSELGAAIRAVRSLGSLPVVAQVTTEEDGNSLDGTPPEDFVPALAALGADVLGVNCSVGPAAMLETVERISRLYGGRLSAQPNAGRPRDVEGRNIYLCSPEYMASYARRFILNGVKLVGGCCGTTPEHIRQIKLAVRSLAPGMSARTATVPAPAGAVPEISPVPREAKSRLANALARGEFVVLARVTPPKGLQCDALLAQARELRIRGIDAIQVSEGSRTGARLSALSVAVLIGQQTGIETLLNYTCRDHSLLGMQSDLLGAHAMGLRNLLVTTGEPPRTGDYQDATAVFDVDSIGLTNVLTRLNHGLDIGGKPLGAPTAFHVGVAANPCALNLDEERRRLRYKLEAGAEFIVTHPVFDPADLAAFLERAAPVGVPVIAGVRVLESLRRAEFLANEVPGVRIPAPALDRMRQAEAEGRGFEEGLALARELAVALRPMAQGIQVWAPHERLDAVGVVALGLATGARATAS